MKTTQFGHIILFILVGFAINSCQNFTPEKVSSQEFLEQELKTFNWNEVDICPTFESCESQTTKLAQQNCFNAQLLTYFKEDIAQNNINAFEEIKDTLKFNLQVDAAGKISLLKIAPDTLPVATLDSIKNRLIYTIQKLPTISPAYKRGIPVKTTWWLPVVIQTEPIIN